MSEERDTGDENDSPRPRWCASVSMGIGHRGSPCQYCDHVEPPPPFAELLRFDPEQLDAALKSIEETTAQLRRDQEIDPITMLRPIGSA